jgi:hypothetical protein
MGAVVVAMLIAFPLLGLMIRRWHTLTFPIVGWPLFYLGLTHHWSGYGTGDGSQHVATMLTLVGVGSTALAVSIARAFQPPSAHLLR